MGGWWRKGGGEAPPPTPPLCRRTHGSEWQGLVVMATVMGRLPSGGKEEAAERAIDVGGGRIAKVAIGGAVLGLPGPSTWWVKQTTEVGQSNNGIITDERGDRDVAG